MQKKSGIFALFYKKSDKNFVGFGKSSTFAPAKRNMVVLMRNDIGVWCNGNTTDSGPVILGSSPSTPTEKKRFPSGNLFFLFIIPFPCSQHR